MSTEIITFRLGFEYVKKVDKAVKTNRRWNDRSDLIRTLLELYSDNPQFKKQVHGHVATRITEPWLDGH